jgi:hypothetical protein
MNAQLRVADVHKARESALARLPDAPPIETGEYVAGVFAYRP